MKSVRRATSIFTKPQHVIRTQNYCCVKEIEHSTKVLTKKNMNENIIKLEYAVRGPIPARAQDLEKELKKGVKKPFSRVIHANIGDCHAMGQVPISFIREVMACTFYPELMNCSIFKEDVKAKAAQILNYTSGCSIGSLTGPVGLKGIREGVAEYIRGRDGYDCNYKDVLLITGGSTGVKYSLLLLATKFCGIPTGVMIPIPTYPLYTAVLAEFGLIPVNYYLDEGDNWGLKIEELERAFKEGSKNCKIRCIAVINPGNPTGQVFTKESINNVVKFAHDKGLMIMTDEVYQHNIYEGEFISFKKGLMDMGPPYNKMELISMMSVSKGYMGECGIRGGWLEMTNIDPNCTKLLVEGVLAQGRCPPTSGQIVAECVARPPKEGDPSYCQFKEESDYVINSLREKATLIAKLFNNMKGMSCNALQGAMYAFPKLQLPQKAIEAAKKAGQVPDVFYVYSLLEQTGICCVPGSGFGQFPGTFHFRVTILPKIELLKEMAVHFEKFHNKFTSQYA